MPKGGRIILPPLLALPANPCLISRDTFLQAFQPIFHLFSGAGKVHTQKPFSIPVLVSVRKIKTAVAADKTAKFCAVSNYIPAVKPKQISSSGGNSRYSFDFPFDIILCKSPVFP